MSRVLTVSARLSMLSQKQVAELFEHLPYEYNPIWIETHGDQDLVSSLADMEQSDFFTREVDQAVLRKESDIGVHSAKDLPCSLPKGIEVIALTKGGDPRDVLVLPDHIESISAMPRHAVVGVSSPRRRECVPLLRPDLISKDIRGTIPHRLLQLDNGLFDGVIVAYVALLRLGIKRKCVFLPLKTPDLQGKLAVVARCENTTMKKIFAPLDNRKSSRRILYCGLKEKKDTVHYPLIQVVPRSIDHFDIKMAMLTYNQYTHVVFTSQNGVRLFFKCLEFYKETLEGKQVFAVGSKTAECLQFHGVDVDGVAERADQEGVMQMISKVSLKNDYILIPQSSQARSFFMFSCMLKGIRCQPLYMYDIIKKNIDKDVNLEHFHDIIFTSPSSVKVFFHRFKTIPKHLRFLPIGPVTQAAIDNRLVEASDRVVVF